ncbi:FemAB-related protein, PEP-CTERM system-associated [Malonomonas rubra DSM 5091]|uniref:FemAB-related protein, PEP-CTERM system-associated n=1 Tax=Malonomonas rubra DSM 5091 TaxID=1122189 RepID=A0A1M6KE92_MALRU|nr:FemAB family XrtA/PEP-CTERM system-associated protein [Malonomonas rubra]SHJ57260.1 FemAB-related protein, PEP-CTERM system-associated [Malonomonas rubra DSM 5091]
MQIRIATTADQPAWDEYVQNHSEGIAYQLFAWGQAVKQAYGLNSKNLLAESSGAICGVLPLVEFAVPLRGKSLISLPYCDAGGVLADSPEVANDLVGFAVAEAAGANCEIRSSVELSSGPSNQTDKVRMLLELPVGSEQLLAGLKSKLRSQVKKPIRDGLTVKMGGEELVEIFYRVFAANMRDLGSPVHSLLWIKSVVACYAENCRVAVVYTPEGEPAAAGIILLHRQTVSIPWASALREFNRLNPNMLLYWTFLQFAADNGYRAFDFGRSTPGEGTYKFKQQWGAQPKPLFWYQWPDDGVVAEAGKTQKSSKRELIAGIWQKLPVPLATAVGSQVRKYISL